MNVHSRQTSLSQYTYASSSAKANSKGERFFGRTYFSCEPVNVFKAIH